VITAETNRSLFEIYFLIRKNPAWIADCKDAGFNQEELDQLDRFDDEFFSYDPEMQAHKNIKFTYDTDDEEMKIIAEELDRIYREFAEERSHGRALLDILVWSKIRGVDQLEKRLKSRRSRQLFSPSERGSLTDLEILRARETPLRVVAGDEKRIPCPFHGGESNNFAIYDRTGYCFVCGEWADAIKWLMKLSGLSFVDAVKRLGYGVFP
jgi:hypothetical protein